MVGKGRHVGYVRVVHVTSRLHCNDPLKNSGNRLSLTSSGSRSRWLPRRSGKASTLRRTLHTARRPEIVHRCSRALALLRWMLSVAAVVRAFRAVATSAIPRLASLARRPCRSVLEPPSPRSVFTHACLASCAAGQSELLVLFVIMLALTLASSTPAPFPRTLFATLVTSRRRVLERRRREALAQGLLVCCLHPGSSCSSLLAVWLEISPVVVRQHLLSRVESTVCRFHDISVWHLHVRDHTFAIHSALRSFTLQQCSCRYMTISAGYVCDRRLQVQ